MEKRYEEAVWAWFIPRAQIHTGSCWLSEDYGGDRAEQAREHLLECGVDLSKSELPNLGHIDEFAGTGCPCDEIEAVCTSKLACKCGEIDTPSWRSRDTYGIPGTFTLGEILAAVLAEADELDLKEPRPPQPALQELSEGETQRIHQALENAEGMSDEEWADALLDAKRLTTRYERKDET